MADGADGWDGKDHHGKGKGKGGKDHQGKGRDKGKDAKGKGKGGKDKGKADNGDDPNIEQRHQMYRILIPGWEPSWGEPDWAQMFHPRSTWHRETFNSQRRMRPWMHFDWGPYDWGW